MNNFSTWLTFVMLAIFSTMVAIASTYPAGARFMPFVVGIPAIFLCLLQLFNDWMKSRHPAFVEAHFHSAPRAGEEAVMTATSAVAAEAAREAAAEAEEFGPHTVRMEVTIWVYLLAYLGSVLCFGFLFSIPVLVALYLWREAEVKAHWALLSGGVCVALLYLLFQRTLQFQLHKGFFAQDLYRFLGL